MKKKEGKIGMKVHKIQNGIFIKKIREIDDKYRNFVIKLILKLNDKFKN